MHPYIAYALLAVIAAVVIGGILQWRRSTSRSSDRSFRHTFDDSRPRR